MLTFHLRPVIKIKFSFLLLLALFLLLERLALGQQLLWAALWHELGHILILMLQSRPPTTLDLSAFGLRLEREGEGSFLQELLLYLAGPVFNIGAALLLQPVNKVAAAFHLILAALNLLPLEPLDGGNILRLFLEQLFPLSATDRAVRAIRHLVLFFLFLGAIRLLLRTYNPSLLAFVLLLALGKS